MTNYDPNLLARFRKPHSFQAAELHSAADQAGAAVVDGSAAPATFHGCGDRGQSLTDDSPRTSARSACDATVDASPSSATLPRRKRVIDGYDSYDVEAALRGIEQALPFALAAFRCHLENNEHVASFVDFESFAAGLSDLVADELRGPLMKRMDEMRGDR